METINNYDTYWRTVDLEGASKKFDATVAFLPVDSKSVLDLGGGIGALSRALVRSGYTGSYTLVELSSSAVTRAKEVGLDSFVCDFDSGPLPFADNSFDMVVLSDVLEHMKNPWAVLREAARVSRKYVFVHGPNFASLACRFDAVRGYPIRQMVTHKNGSLVDPQGRKANHIYYITYNNLVLWAMRTGLGIYTARVFWYKRYMFVRPILERFFRNWGAQYDIVFTKIDAVSPDDKNFTFFS